MLRRRSSLWQTRAPKLGAWSCAASLLAAIACSGESAIDETSSTCSGSDCASCSGTSCGADASLSGGGSAGAGASSMGGGVGTAGGGAAAGSSADASADVPSAEVCFAPPTTCGAQAPLSLVSNADGWEVRDATVLRGRAQFAVLLSRQAESGQIRYRAVAVDRDGGCATRLAEDVTIAASCSLDYAAGSGSHTIVQHHCTVPRGIPYWDLQVDSHYVGTLGLPSVTLGLETHIAMLADGTTFMATLDARQLLSGQPVHFWIPAGYSAGPTPDLLPMEDAAAPIDVAAVDAGNLHGVAMLFEAQLDGSAGGGRLVVLSRDDATVASRFLDASVAPIQVAAGGGVVAVAGSVQGDGGTGAWIGLYDAQTLAELATTIDRVRSLIGIAVSPTGSALVALDSTDGGFELGWFDKVGTLAIAGSPFVTDAAPTVHPSAYGAFDLAPDGTWLLADSRGATSCMAP